MNHANPLIFLLLAVFFVGAAPLVATLSGAAPTADGQAPVVTTGGDADRAAWRDLSVIERLDHINGSLGFDSDDYDSCVHECQRTQTVLTDCHAQCSQQ